MTRYYLIYLLLMGLVTLSLYGIDKRRARRGAWRISEKLLLGCSLAGGAWGGLLSMHLFRHKTKKGYFFATNLFGIALHVAVFILLIAKS